MQYKDNFNSAGMLDKFVLKTCFSISILFDYLTSGLLTTFHSRILPVFDRLILGLRKKTPLFSLLIIKMWGRQEKVYPSINRFITL